MQHNLTMKTFELFPTPVSVFDLGRNITSEEKSCIDLLLKSTTSNGANKKSKDNYALRQDVLGSLQKFCVDSVSQFASEILRHKEVGLRITQSWLNKSVKGDSHHSHRHPNSVLSGVLYIETGEEDRINFTKNADKESFFFEATDWNKYNSEDWWLPVKATELFVFPSHLWHSVPPVESESRISLSFNTFPTGSFGSVDLLSRIDL